MSNNQRLGLLTLQEPKGINDYVEEYITLNVLLNIQYNQKYNIINIANMKQGIVQNADLGWLVILLIGVSSAFIGAFLGNILSNYF